MRIFLLQWRFSTSDGYDNSEGLIGMYKTRKSAEDAATKWSDTLNDEQEDYNYSFEEMTVHA